MRKERLTAKYWAHEGHVINNITQVFEGDYQDIAKEYFEIYGDILLTLTNKDNAVVYINKEGIVEVLEMYNFQEILDCLKMLEQQERGEGAKQ